MQGGLPVHLHCVTLCFHSHADVVVCPLSVCVQAGSEGRADASVADFPACSSLPLDRGGRLAAQDASGDHPSDEERPELHASKCAHRQGPQTAGGGFF